MEGYIIFFVFIIIMLVVEIQIIPITSTLGGISSSGLSIPGSDSNFGSGANVDASQFSFAFLSLLLTQGFFAGLVIGKLAEGNIKAGIKHSFILVAMAILISTGAKLIF